jgi:hypothetical protein
VYASALNKAVTGNTAAAYIASYRR